MNLITVSNKTLMVTGLFMDFGERWLGMEVFGETGGMRASVFWGQGEGYRKNI